MLREFFLNAVNRYAHDPHKAERLWSEISKQYYTGARHYHTLLHLDSLLTELLPHQKAFANFDTIIFAIAYHDVVYNPLKNNNEEKSAELCEKRLAEIDFPAEQCKVCEHLILATKKHESADEETNLFTDADLSILGATPEVYQQYTKQIRREYKLYPDFLYNPGRKKVLQHFLNMQRIFKTTTFHNLYENQARINLEAELQKL